MNRVLVITSIVTAAAVLIYTGFAGLQWLAIRKQAAGTKEQVTKMEGQLDVMKDQASLMQESLTETRNLVGLNERAVKASEAQAIAADLSARAAQRSAELAEGAVYIGERAYVEIKDMQILNLTQGAKPTIKITWVNGGRTPAWHLRCLPDVVVGKEPKTNQFSFIDDDVSDISGSFLPPGDERTIEYPTTHVDHTGRTC